ncbi:AAA family ATPase [Actinoalloteichus sp. AHMU CJ021]|uniref:AAA family ATPase n=1 Tax=Actinoalloteichus sp. AHMU CJ021 TaxID=2072503 RepID=UPI0026855E6F
MSTGELIFTEFDEKRPFRRAGHALVGRREHLRAVRTALAAVAAGDEAVILVEGGAGTGKSALLRAAGSSAHGLGLPVLPVSASSYEADEPLGLARRICEAAGTEPPALVDDIPEARRVVLERVTAWARGAPALLAIDDFQWCDAASLRCLSFLLRRGVRGLGVLASLTTGVSGADPVLVDEAQRSHPRPVRVRLGPLGRAEADRLVAGVLGPVPADLRAALFEWTGGNPFLLDEVLTELPGHPRGQVTDIVPRTVYPWLSGLLANGNPVCLPVVRALAALGDHASPTVLGEVAGLSALEVDYGIRALAELSLLRPGPRPAFAHPVVEAAVARQITPHELVRLRLVGARWLVTTGAPETSVISYLVDSGVADHPEGAELVVATARGMVDRSPPEEAVARLRDALSRRLPLPVRTELLQLCARAELDLDVGLAERRLGEAVVLLGCSRRPAVLVDHARALHALGRLDEAARLLCSVDAETPAGERDPALRDRVRLELATIVAGDPAVAMAPTSDPRDAVAAVVHLLVDGGVRGAPRHGLALGDLWDLLTPAAPDGLPLTWFTAVRALLSAGEGAGLLSYARLWVSAARQGTLRLALGHAQLAEALFRLDRIRCAGAAVNDVLRQWETLDHPGGCLPIIAAMPPVLDTLIERDELDSAVELLRQLPLNPDRRPHWHQLALLLRRGRLRRLLGDPAGGLSDLVRCGRVLRERGSRVPHPLRWRRHATVALLDLGRLDAARRLIDVELSDVRRRSPVGNELGVTLRLAGRVAGPSVGLGLLSQSVEVLEAGGSRVELARSLGELGTALSRMGRSRAARSRLRRACGLAEETGAVRLRACLEARLRDAGGRVRKQVTGVGALTAGERRVARLAATGHTNRQIAAELFITRRAVEMHLTQVYRKLGISGRGQLARALDDADDPVVRHGVVPAGR